MSSREFHARLRRRLKAAGAVVPAEEVLQRLERYYRLLAKWNSKVNLTSLPLDAPTDAAFDRLLVEPLVAAPLVSAGRATWFDLGSGGGSPAVPLEIARPELQLTMVESKARKAAFLREAVRELALNATVENARFEEVSARQPGAADMVTVRAVRADNSLFKSAQGLMRSGGQLLLFTRRSEFPSIPGFELSNTVPLSADHDSVLLVCLRNVPRGT